MTPDFIHAGRVFGRLTVRGREFRNSAGRRWEYWLCDCECGMRGKAVRMGALESGVTLSCGCLQREKAARTCCDRNETHGGSSLPEYIIWKTMRSRCNNPRNRKFKDYGGRGIKVCDRWNSFELFLADMKSRPSSRHSIDRQNNSLGYEPGNCHWALCREQNNNRRDNRVLTHCGVTATMAQWADSTGINYGTIKSRLKIGWDVSKALTTPARHLAVSNA